MAQYEANPDIWNGEGHTAMVFWTSLVVRREACRCSSYAILELARRGSSVIGGNRKDMLRMIAAQVWNTRRNESWKEK